MLHPAALPEAAEVGKQIYDDIEQYEQSKTLMPAEPPAPKGAQGHGLSNT